jgi:hypothetical protein
LTKNVQPSITIEIHERDPAAVRFDKIALLCVVPENKLYVEASLSGHIGKNASETAFQQAFPQLRGRRCALPYPAAPLQC